MRLLNPYYFLPNGRIILFLPITTQNTSHDLFNSYFKSATDNSHDFRGQDLSIPHGAGANDAHGQDMRSGAGGGGGHNAVDGHAMRDAHAINAMGAHVPESDHNMHLGDADFPGAAAAAAAAAATALPHDMRVNSASSSIRDDQPQDLHMPGSDH